MRDRNEAFRKTYYGIYDENYDLKKCNECCDIIIDEQSEDETFLFQHILKMNCNTIIVKVVRPHRISSNNKNYSMDFSML